jgi:hypothetical protein
MNLKRRGQVSLKEIIEMLKKQGYENVEIKVKKEGKYSSYVAIGKKPT